MSVINETSYASSGNREMTSGIFSISKYFCRFMFFEKFNFVILRKFNINFEHLLTAERATNGELQLADRELKLTAVRTTN